MGITGEPVGNAESQPLTDLLNLHSDKFSRGLVCPLTFEKQGLQSKLWEALNNSDQ